MYNWGQVAERTLYAYAHAMSKPCPGDLGKRAGKLIGCGRVFGLVAVFMAAVDMLWYTIICWLDPEEYIEISRSLPSAVT